MKLEEGVVKFRQVFKKSPSLDYDTIKELNLWRKILYKYNLIGMDKLRYGGFGYGNVSQRLGHEGKENKKSFIITGTQTGNLSELTEEHYTTVSEYYPDRNLVMVEGPIEASSESMTHGTIYDLDDSIRFVFHAHSPQIWKASKKLEIPETNEDVEYGTPAMAKEVKRLFKETDVEKKRIFSMGGHEDGIITFGKTSDETGEIMLRYLAKSSV